MTFSFSEINLWAVLVCAVASFMVGGLWYGLVFAKIWVAVHRFTDDQLALMAKKQGRNFAYFSQPISSWLQSFQCWRSTSVLHRRCKARRSAC